MAIVYYTRIMKTADILPAIIPDSYESIADNVELVEPYVQVVQIDLLDGLYTGSYSWPWNTKGRLSHSLDNYIERGLPYWGTVDYEFDCMIVHPAQTLEKLIQLGPRRIVVHAQTLTDPEAEIALLQTYRPYVQIGIALTVHDDIDTYVPVMAEVDYVQCMGVFPVGSSGSVLQEGVYDLIKKVRKLFPDMLIQVDGGVNAENITKLKKAGANRFVSASAIFEKGIVEDNIAELEDLTL